MTHDEQRLSWFYAHTLETSSKNEIDRLFQRVNFFLIGMGFLLTAFAGLVLSCKFTMAGTWPYRLGAVLAIAGLGTSGLFWAINSWNITLIMRRERAMWCQFKRLQSSSSRFTHELETFIKCSLIESRDANCGRILISIFWHPFALSIPAWYTRCLPVLFFLVWLVLGSWLWWPDYLKEVMISLSVALVVPRITLSAWKWKRFWPYHLYRQCVFPNPYEPDSLQTKVGSPQVAAIVREKS